MERKDLTLHDQVAVAAFELFLREVGEAPPQDTTYWKNDLKERLPFMSSYTKSLLGINDDIHR